MSKKNNPIPTTSRSSDFRPLTEAPMPVKCPNCHGVKTIIDGGVHINKVTSWRFEYRTCKACLFKFVAARRLAEDEKG